MTGSPDPAETASKRRHVVLVLALQLDPKISDRRLALPALDIPLVPGCHFVRHADGLGGQDDPNSGWRDVQFALERGPLDGGDPFDVARPDREQLHHSQARFPELVGIGPEDIATGDGIVRVGVGDHHRELLVGVDRGETEAGDSGGAVVTEGDRLAVLAHGDVGLDVVRTVSRSRGQPRSLRSAAHTCRSGCTRRTRRRRRHHRPPPAARPATQRRGQRPAPTRSDPISRSSVEPPFSLRSRPIGTHDVPYTRPATRQATTLDASHITNIGSENECQIAYFEIPVVPVSSVAIAVTWEPFAGKK